MTTTTRVMLLSGFCLLLMLAGWLAGIDLRETGYRVCAFGCWIIFPRVDFPEEFSLIPLTNDSMSA